MMNMLKNKIKLVVVLTSMMLVSCGFIEEKSSVIVELNHQFLGKTFQVNKVYQIEKCDEELKIQKLKYLLTDFKLITVKGDTISIAEKKDYLLGDASKPTIAKELKFPLGVYKKLLLNYGLDYGEDLKDEDNNGVLTDVLDFTSDKYKSDMYWDWATAYRFLNLEGVYTSSEQKDISFKFHNGSHFGNQKHGKELLSDNKGVKVYSSKNISGRIQAHRTLEVDLGAIELERNKDITIQLNVEIDRFFSTMPCLDELNHGDEVSVIVSPSKTPMVANSFVSAFVLKSIQ